MAGCALAAAPAHALDVNTATVDSGIGHKKMQSLQAAGLTAGPAAPAAGARPEARPAGGPRAKAAAGR
ncbi:Uncharacterised protein [Bordetella pertussis]|nr:Uncharacterised protein [Bordetella pertussis]